MKTTFLKYEDYVLKIKPITSGGANFTSNLFAAIVSSPNKADLQLFAKVAALTEKTRETVPDHIYYAERYVYTNLFKKFQLIEDKYDVQLKDRFVVSKLYSFNTNLYEETIVLENLLAKGYTTFDRMKSFDWPYASKAVEVLAKFHALSIAYSEEYPEEYENSCKIMDGKLDELCKSTDRLFSTSLKIALEATKEENKDRLAKYFEDTSKCNRLDYIKGKRRTILIHGDYRQSNLMHKTNEDGTVDIIPVDFQTIQPGCMIADLILFIFTGSDEDFRVRYFDELIEHYYKQLCHSLRVLRLDPDKVYSREDFEFECKEVLPYGLVCCVLFLAIITVETDNAMDLNDDNYVENIVNTKTSDLYPERLNGVINDYVRWGIL